MDVARINFSHGSPQQNLEKAETIKRVREELGRPVALLLDTKGPEIRITTLERKSEELFAGQLFTLTVRQVAGTNEMVSVTFDGLPSRVEVGTRILLDDGLIELEVEQVTQTDIVCRVLNGGVLGERKSVNLPGIVTNMCYMDDKDRADIKFAFDHDFDYIALSFVRSASDVAMVKNYLSELGNSRLGLIAKIENAEGVRNADEILREVDGIMVARGDLGVEIPFEDIPIVQKSLINRCCSAGKKVITATQMLESMIRNPRPTRAEVTDIANAIYDGTSAIMLSGETATGKYPVESLETMVRIAKKTEASIRYKKQLDNCTGDFGKNITTAICHATCTSAHDLGAVAIVAVTLNGVTANMVSRFRPNVQIAAVTPLVKTYMQLALCWGVTPLLTEYKESPEELFRDAAAKVSQAGIAGDGDLIVITGSSHTHTGFTNALQVHILGNVLASGKGEGASSVSARACVFGNGDAYPQFSDGDILVIDRTTNDILRILKRVSGLVTEEEPSASGAVAAAIALDIPVIASVEEAVKRIPNGSSILLDPTRGLIYNNDTFDNS